MRRWRGFSLKAPNTGATSPPRLSVEATALSFTFVRSSCTLGANDSNGDHFTPGRFAGGLCGTGQFRAQAKAEADGAPDFKEVYESIRAHVAGLSEAELNRAAVQGLVSALGPKVTLVTNGASTKPMWKHPWSAGRA